MYKLLDGTNVYTAEEVDNIVQTTGVEAERDRAIAAEQALDDKITAEQQRAEAAEQNIVNTTSSLLADEVIRATVAETELDTKITEERTRAETAELQLQHNITQETQQRDAAIVAVQQSIADEANRATAAEADLTSEMLTLSTRVTQCSTEVGDLSTLTTTDKSSVVAAINEINAGGTGGDDPTAGTVGDLADLTTDDKTSVVAAVNEVDANVNATDSKIGDLSTLTTTEKTSVVASINEVDAAVDATDGKIGDLSTLTTTEKTSIVGAINEISSGNNASDYTFNYTFVVDSDDKFQDWAVGVAGYNYKSVLVKTGKWTSTIGVDLSRSNTVCVMGEPEAKLVFNNVEKGIYYPTLPEDNNLQMGGTMNTGRYIKNLIVEVNSNTDTVAGFDKCINIEDCYCTVYTGGGTYGAAFNECVNIVNCDGLGGANYAEGIGFNNCTTVNNCAGLGTASNTGYGFKGCKGVTYCKEKVGQNGEKCTTAVFEQSYASLVADAKFLCNGTAAGGFNGTNVPTGGDDGAPGGGTEINDNMADYPYIANPRPGQYRWLRFDPNNRKNVLIQGGVVFNLTSLGFNKLVRIDQDTTFNMGSSLLPGVDYNVIITYSEQFGIMFTSKAVGDTTDADKIIGRFSTLCADVGNTYCRVRFPVGSTVTTNATKFLVQKYDKNRDPDFYNFYNKTVTTYASADGGVNGPQSNENYIVADVDHPLNGFVAGDILPESIWCNTWRPASISYDTNRADAMVYCHDYGTAIDVYTQSGTSQQTRSQFGQTNTRSRTPKLHAMDMASVGKKLLTDHEFFCAATGSNENTNIQGSSYVEGSGGHSDTKGRRMISAIGCEDMCGYLWQWLDELGPSDTTADWTSSADSAGLFGQDSGLPYVLLAGGASNLGSRCGSFSRDTLRRRAIVYSNYGARGSSRVVRGQD